MVLSWLRSDHRKYRQFVAFRVGEILELTDLSEWHWISTKLNVADKGTKWQKTPESTSNSRWLRGQDFLRLPVDGWPQETHPDETTVEELKTQFIGVHGQTRSALFQPQRFSDWWKLLRSTGYVFRYINNLMSKCPSKITGPLLRRELQWAESELFKEAQLSSYEDEVNLNRIKPIDKSSCIFNLCPILDDKGVLRVNSRIHLSKSATEDLKRQVILLRGTLSPI